jgi:hypothetical protein
MLLHCTSRLRAAIGGETKPALNTTAPASESDFYANLIWIERPKCVLGTHAGTVFSIFTRTCERATYDRSVDSSCR